MTKIEWTDTVWNPVRGCSLVSAGCANCYAMKQAHRFSGPGQPYEGLTELGPQGPRWTGRIRLVPEALEAPLHWKQPRRVFVNSMSDLFHEEVPDEFIDRVFETMEGGGCDWSEREGKWTRRPWHTFQVLTKRPERMRRYMTRRFAKKQVYADQFNRCPTPEMRDSPAARWARQAADPSWYQHVWLGVSVENQQTADERIPILLQTPAAVRFVSAEPLLGPVDLSTWFRNCHSPEGHSSCVACSQGKRLARPDWIIAGGESGPGARPCDLAWIRSIKDQCQAAGVPVFVKQIGSQPRGWCAGIACSGDPESSYESDYCDLYEASEIPVPCKGKCGELVDRKGGDMNEWPADLRVREFPC